MIRTILILILFITAGGITRAQTVDDTTVVPVTDSVITVDTTRPVQPVLPPPLPRVSDSVSKRPGTVHSWQLEPGTRFSIQEISQAVWEHHPWLGFSTAAFTMHSEYRQFHGKELLFYSIVFLLMIFAILRRAFPKYFNDLFRLFFRTTLKQRQIREQLMQTPLPSLLLNTFFILSAGLYASFILQHYHINPVGNFWLMFFYCCLGLSIAYFVKFLGLKLSGWLFNMREAADSYIFIVFIVNKMIGILLLPFIIILAFTTGPLYTVGLNLSYCLLAGLLAYRFILSFAAIRNKVKVNPFHFFLYLLAFEIAPLLLVYKGLLQYFRQTA